MPPCGICHAGSLRVTALSHQHPRVRVQQEHADTRPVAESGSRGFDAGQRSVPAGDRAGLAAEQDSWAAPGPLPRPAGRRSRRRYGRGSLARGSATAMARPCARAAATTSARACSIAAGAGSRSISTARAGIGADPRRGRIRPARPRRVRSGRVRARAAVLPGVQRRPDRPQRRRRRSRARHSRCPAPARAAPPRPWRRAAPRHGWSAGRYRRAETARAASGSPSRVS